MVFCQGNRKATKHDMKVKGDYLGKRKGDKKG